MSKLKEEAEEYFIDEVNEEGDKVYFTRRGALTIAYACIPVSFMAAYAVTSLIMPGDVIPSAEAMRAAILGAFVVYSVTSQSDTFLTILEKMEYIKEETKENGDEE